MLFLGLQHGDLVDVIECRVAEATLGGGQQVRGVLNVTGPGLGGGGVLLEGGVQVRRDLVEVAFGIFHLLHVFLDEPLKNHVI